MAVSLKDKVVLITGASSGFGWDSAHLFAREGAKVILAARRIERMQALAESIQSEGGEALVMPVDMAQRQEIDLMVKTVIDIYGQIDILFNNAGFGRLKPLEELDPDRDIETQVDVNLLGVIQTTRAVLPYMLARRSGHIINMSSVAGRIAAPLYTIYAATKFGVHGFTTALRREVASQGIRVSGVYPGPAATEFVLHTGKPPSRFARLRMSSDFVARRIVGLARYPRRSLVIPWYYRFVFWIEFLFPGLVDWALGLSFSRQIQNLED